MFCSDCGYSLTAFEKDCPRCARLRARRKGCPHCGTEAPVDAAQCAKCGHVYRTVFSPTQAPGRDDAWEPLPAAPPQPPPPAYAAAPPPTPVATPLNAQMLACRVCGNTATQKVSAVCQSGAWSGGSSSLSVGAIHTRNGNIPIGAVTATRSSGASEIAHRLMPPRRPFFTANWAGSILTPILGLIAVMIAGVSGGAAPATAAAAVAGGMWFFMLRVEGDGEAAGQARHQSALAQWEHAMHTWNRLFYCSRCDHVYDPQGGASAPPQGMPTLLYAQAPPLLVAGAVRELPHRLTVERAGLIAGISTAGVIALIWGMGLVAGQSQPAAAAPPTATVPADQPAIEQPSTDQPPAVSSDASTDPNAAPSSVSPAPAEPAYTMRTRAGGGPPPDTHQFNSGYGQP